MKKTTAVLMAMMLLLTVVPSGGYAANTATHGNITGKSVVAGLTSLIIWPGIGQYVNDNTTEKNWTHAIIGILPPFRLWSGWDALIQRKGGRWDGRI